MAIKHSIVMICYNQENYIRKALDSVLDENIKPYEIIIGDDFSTDGTRVILQEYKEKYPEIIKLVLNEKNLGIFPNLNSITSKANGDIISFLAGDDWFRPNFLANMNKTINELALDPRSTRFILLPSVVIHQPDGVEILKKNDSDLLLKYSANGLLLRRCFHSTNTGLSRALFDLWPKYQNDSNKIGPWADFVHHMTHMQYCDRMVIMNCEGPVYRSGVGVASRTGGQELNRSFQRALNRIQSNYLKGELKLNDVDANYLEFMVASELVCSEFSLGANVRLFKALVDVVKLDICEIKFL